MDELVKVKVEYVGFMSKITGNSSETIEIFDNIQSIPMQIRSFLKNKYDISQPVLILVNGKNVINYMKLHEGGKIEEGTCFKVMPIISGG